MRFEGCAAHVKSVMTTLSISINDRARAVAEAYATGRVSDKDARLAIAQVILEHDLVEDALRGMKAERHCVDEVIDEVRSELLLAVAGLTSTAPLDLHRIADGSASLRGYVTIRARNLALTEMRARRRARARDHECAAEHAPPHATTADWGDTEDAQGILLLAAADHLKKSHLVRDDNRACLGTVILRQAFDLPPLLRPQTRAERIRLLDLIEGDHTLAVRSFEAMARAVIDGDNRGLAQIEPGLADLWLDFEACHFLAIENSDFGVAALVSTLARHALSPLPRPSRKVISAARAAALRGTGLALSHDLRSLVAAAVDAVIALHCAPFASTDSVRSPDFASGEALRAALAPNLLGRLALVMRESGGLLGTDSESVERSLVETLVAAGAQMGELL